MTNKDTQTAISLTEMVGGSKAKMQYSGPNSLNEDGTFVTYPVSDSHGGESHLDQQRNVAVPQIMDSNALYPGCFRCSGHFMMQTGLGNVEDSVGGL